MNTEIEELKEELVVLKKRIEVLEKTEKRRKIAKMVSIIVKILILLAIVFAIWRIYDYVSTSINNIPNIVTQGIKDFDFWGIFK